MSYHGVEARAIDSLIRMLCGSSTMQERANASESELELLHVFSPAIQIDPDDKEPLWPCVTMELPPSGALSWQKIAGGAKNQFRLLGNLDLVIWDVDRIAGDSHASWMDFCNFQDCVIQDILDSAGYSDNLSITNVEQSMSHLAIDDCESVESRFYIAQWAIEYDGA